MRGHPEGSEGALSPSSDTLRPKRDFITLWEVPRFARNDDGKMNEGRGEGSKSDNWRPKR